MQPFEYEIPADYTEAGEMLAASGARAYLGGTDLLIRMRSGFIQPARVVDLKRLTGMREIVDSEEGGLVIGAACTMNQIAADSRVRARYGLLAQACRLVASDQVRQRATIGGNCCNASPAADSIPALVCLEAEAGIDGSEGRYRLPIEDFLTGPGMTALRSSEFLTSLHLPPSPLGAIGVFNKLGSTKIGDIALASVAVYAWPEGERWGWRIALGAVGPTPLRAPAAEAILATDTSPAAVAAAVQAAVAAARPIDDIRAGAAYRRAMVGVLARRGIETVLAQTSG